MAGRPVFRIVALVILIPLPMPTVCPSLWLRDTGTGMGGPWGGVAQEGQGLTAMAMLCKSAHIYRQVWTFIHRGNSKSNGAGSSRMTAMQDKVLGLAKRKGILRVKDLHEAGIHPEYLRRLCEKGTALTDEFASDRIKQTQWAAFLKRNALADKALELSKVVQDLRVFLLEPLHTAAQKRTLSKSWKPGGPWA
jgi:hypothetical protein